MISVGIDVSKNKSDVCILKPGGEVLAPPFEMLHTIEGVLSLVRRLKAYDEEVRVVLEATGHYHWPVVSLLVEKGIFVTCVNALRMKRYCSLSIRRAKTDRIDAIQIASYGITYWSELTAVQPGNDIYDELRVFSRQYYHYTSLIVKAKINLSNLLDRTMPNIQNLLEDRNGGHKLTDFIQRYWHFANILAMGENDFSSDYCEWAKKQGYRLNERKAKEIFALSQNGIPVMPNTSSTKVLMLEAVRVLQELEKSRNTILSHMQQLASTLPEYSAVLAMGGVGTTLAPRIIAEIGDIRRFYSPASLIAYAGIDVPPYQSGSFTATNRNISKRGSKYLRKVGYEIIQSIMRQKPVEDAATYLFIQKKLSEGKNGKVSKIAGLNKFLRIYYARVNEIYELVENQLIFGNEI